MIKPRLRLYVCASAVAVTLSGSVLTQAAGPGEFISRLWKRDPAPKKEVTTGFSPFRWLKREESDSKTGSVKVSDGGRRVVSERPELTSDPFLAEQQPRVAANSSGATVNKGVIVRPQPRSPQQQIASTNSPRNTIPASAPTLPEITTDVNKNRLPELESVVASDRPTASPPIAPPLRTEAPQPARNRDFVDGFDSEFQKLFKEVIDESRQQKERLSSPKLPDSAVADFGPAIAETLPEAASASPDSGPQEFAEFGSEQSQPSASDLIQQSRAQMESSALARQANARNGNQQTDTGPLLPDQPADQQSSVAAASHSASRQSLYGNASSTGSEFQPYQLPNRTATATDPRTGSGRAMPERRFATSSEGWLDRGQSVPKDVIEPTDAPELQPVVRVVPGNPGNGIVIESGQWSPIRPRVTSNVAPSRSVPDTSQFRRLSFEGSDEAGAVQAIGEDEQSQNTDAGQPDQSLSGRPTSFAPSALDALNDSEKNMPMMIIPDSRTGQSLDAADLGAALAAAPEPPPTKLATFEWPDESEIAPSSPAGGISWGATAFCLTIAAAAAHLFFRRKRQDGVFGMTGPRTGVEIS